MHTYNFIHHITNAFFQHLDCEALQKRRHCVFHCALSGIGWHVLMATVSPTPGLNMKVSNFLSLTSTGIIFKKLSQGFWNIVNARFYIETCKLIIQYIIENKQCYACCYAGTRHRLSTLNLDL